MADAPAGIPAPGTDPVTEPTVVRRQRTSTALVVTAVAALAATGLTVVALTSGPEASAAETTTQSPFAVSGRGASVPFVEQEAEDAATNGTVIGADRTYTTLPSEASGRRAVKLDAPESTSSSPWPSRPTR